MTQEHHKPSPLVIDDESFNMECLEGDDVGSAYVDVRLDTIPHLSDDPDYSESPELLRRAAQWLLQAAEWLEERQGS